jgi:alkylated DNA repair dioxygenase AlkB
MLPDGLIYRREFIDERDETGLVRAIQAGSFAPVRMYGVEARRRAVHYGWSYSFDAREVSPGPPLPGYLLGLRERAAALIAVPPEDLAEALVLEYPAGAAIGWHRDAPPFGTVIGVSLSAACRMRFRRGKVGAWETTELLLEPRSAYVIAGPARSAWQHSIPPVKEPRFSITFRTLRKKPRAAA